MLMTAQVVRAVRVVEAVKRITDPLQKYSEQGITFFSRLDVWLFDARLDSKTCELCRLYDDIGIFYGYSIRGIFPHLKILDRDTIGGDGPGDTGLVHPNCRCRLNRMLEEEK